MANVQDELEILKNVQKMDKQIYDAELFLEQMPVQLDELNQAFEEKKSTYHAIEENLKNLKLGVREKEMQLTKEEDEINKFDGQLTQIKTNKEYTAMLEQISSIKADKGIMEEKILTDWQQIERVTEDLGKEKETFKKDEEILKKDKQSIEAQGTEAKAKVGELKEQRNKILAPVSDEIKSLYEKVLAKREGVALAPIERENCSACNYRLRPQIINEVRLLENITCCESCTRILYYIPE